jgi:Ca2+:H+ antiporter
MKLVHDDHPWTARLRSLATRWTSLVPALAVVLLVSTWGRELPAAVVALVTPVLAGAVLAAVHHAEVVAHRVGEPFGSLVLAVAVTIIEVALIVTLMRRTAAARARPWPGTPSSRP